MSRIFWIVWFSLSQTQSGVTSCQSVGVHQAWYSVCPAVSDQQAGRRGGQRVCLLSVSWPWQTEQFSEQRGSTTPGGGGGGGGTRLSERERERGTGSSRIGQTRLLPRYLRPTCTHASTS